MESQPRNLDRFSLKGLKARMLGLCPDRELYLRSNGHVRFLKISSGLQLKALGAAAIVAAVWLIVSGVTLVSQYHIRGERVAISQQAIVAKRAASKIAAFRETVDTKADRLETRQEFLDTLAAQYFGATQDAEGLISVPTQTAEPEVKPTTTSALALPGVDRLERIEQRQLAFVDYITQVALARATRTEKTVRKLGINPKRLTRSGSGGPFVPFGNADSGDSLDDPRFAKLVASLARLDRLERALLSVPSFKPAEHSRLSSRFGFRFDPFTRRPARHTGQDFAGRRGEPIRAAAPGRVVRANWWSGYGKAVEIDHGNGLRTRYGHMSALGVKPGERVTRGQMIGRMGSTGRSTGNHLHFEVRIDGRAVNPRPFLEASADVLKIQSNVKQRIVGSGRAL